MAFATFNKNRKSVRGDNQEEDLTTISSPSKAFQRRSNQDGFQTTRETREKEEEERPASAPLTRDRPLETATTRDVHHESTTTTIAKQQPTPIEQPIEQQQQQQDEEVEQQQQQQQQHQETTMTTTNDTTNTTTTTTTTITSYRHVNNSSSMSNTSMAACLYVMDDTIRLTEWIAYHYTVLPLGRLVVAVDPQSRFPHRIDQTLQRWKDRIDLTTWYNDSWVHLAYDEGWDRQYYYDTNRPRPWTQNKNNPLYKSQAHKRRQNSFLAKCLHRLAIERQYRWVLLVDSDEYLLYNYHNAPHLEDPNEYAAITPLITKQQIDATRQAAVPVRRGLPPLHQHVTIAQYLHPFAEQVEAATGEPPRCYRFPHIPFKSPSNDDTYQKAPHDAQFLLSTLRLTRAGERTSNFSKALLDLSTAKSTGWFTYKQVINVHSPIRRMCGRRKLSVYSGSSADFISSILRIHHYRSGTAAMQWERSNDYRGPLHQRAYNTDMVVLQNNNTDIADWYPWFLDKMQHNTTLVNQLLLDPLHELYNEYFRVANQDKTTR